MGDESAERCETCKYWVDGGAVDKEHGYEGRDREGDCERYPPVPISGERYAAYPLVLSFRVCGEWKAKDAPRTPLPVVEPLASDSPELEDDSLGQIGKAAQAERERCIKIVRDLIEGEWEMDKVFTEAIEGRIRKGE